MTMVYAGACREVGHLKLLLLLLGRVFGQASD